MNTRLRWGYPGILTALPAAHTPVHGKKLTPSPPTSVEFGVDWQGKEGPWSFCDCSCCWLVFRASGIPLPLLPYHLCLPLISAVELTAFKLEESFTFNHQKKKKPPWLEGQMKRWSLRFWWQVLSARGNCHFAVSWVHGAACEALLNATARIWVGKKNNKKNNPSFNRYL